MCLVLPAINDLLLEGPGQRQIYASRPSVFRGCPKLRMLALRLDFRLVAFSAQQSLLERIGTFVFLFSFAAYLWHAARIRGLIWRVVSAWFGVQFQPDLAAV